MGKIFNTLCAVTFGALLYSGIPLSEANDHINNPVYYNNLVSKLSDPQTDTSVDQIPPKSSQAINGKLDYEKVFKYLYLELKELEMSSDFDSTIIYSLDSTNFTYSRI